MSVDEARRQARNRLNTDDADAGRRRVVLEGVSPSIDGGRFPVKRVLGDRVRVEADVFTDGHDAVRGRVGYRPQAEGKASADEWQWVELEPLVNDRWRAEFLVDTLGRWEFVVEAWVDAFVTWRRDMRKRVDARTDDVEVYLEVGARLIDGAAERADTDDAKALRAAAERIRDDADELWTRAAHALSDEVAERALRWPDRSLSERTEVPLEVRVDRPKARFSSWYEMFPRSAGKPDEHGTLRDVIERLDYVAKMGFDVLYLPPIHPIGRVHRKGKNNARTASEGDLGSPWAIGSDEGGHTAIHPELGTEKDFDELVRKAAERGIDIALDIAFQAAPDHPWVKEHPEWFRELPDGTIQYAENPPKKYEDIYPFDFESSDWRGMWEALEGVFRHWCERGVTIFRVDNPHTKAFPFWEWCIEQIQRDYPETIFLAEAFTRPKIMYRLAKLGFTQSYTYFAWRNTKWELETYLRELTQTEALDFFQPNFWPNTPDILPEFLQVNGRPAFMLRAALAATMTASYGLYGPAYELQAHQPRHPGSEEYLDSEKYEMRHWDLDAEHSLAEYLGRLNAIRRQNAALQRNDTLRFHGTDNERIIAYSKSTLDGENIVLTVANLDPHYTQSGWVDVDLDALGLPHDEPFQLHDLLGEGRYLWQGHRNYVELDPHASPVQVFRIGRRVRSEHDYEYFL